MRKLLLTIAWMAGVALFASCGTTASAQRSEKASELAAKVKDALTEQNFKIEVNFMTPLKGMARSVTTDHYLQVNGETLFSYLPYAGDAFNIPYGGGQGLNFTESIDSYKLTQRKSDEFVVEIGVKNSEDTYVFTITVFDNGRASIDVRGRQRDPISFNGEMRF